MAEVEKEVSRSFWEAKAKDSSNRWTPTEMLEFEAELLSPYVGPGREVLDLGSGHGELSRRISSAAQRLVAVDWIQDFERSFTGSNHQFVQSTVTDFSTVDHFDLVLLFGVVTYLTEFEENLVYDKCAGLLKPGGVLVVKNQCARGDEFVFTGVSAALGTEYSGRYPNSQAQTNRLTHRFADVEVVAYPSEFNPWDDTFHTAFICRNPSGLDRAKVD